MLNGGPYMVSGRPLILKSMPHFDYFSNEGMSRVPVWIRFPNLPLCCWSPSCLSKIASVLGKPIQSDHVTSMLSRMSYARVLVEIDLREELQHFVAVSLLSGPLLQQKVVYYHYPNSVTFAMLLVILGLFVLKLPLLMLLRFWWNKPCPFNLGRGLIST